MIRTQAGYDPIGRHQSQNLDADAEVNVDENNIILALLTHIGKANDVGIMPDHYRQIMQQASSYERLGHDFDTICHCRDSLEIGKDCLQAVECQVIASRKMRRCAQGSPRPTEVSAELY